MALAQFGPLTGVAEALAAAVGAGAVLGSVVVGILDLIQGSSKADLERRALASGYVGGAAGALLAVADLVLRYGLMR